MSTKTKFTSGPWTVVTGGPPNSEGQIRQTTSGTLIADCPIFKNNAALIAAAPEMYEALNELNCKLTELNAEGKLPNDKKLNKLIQRAFDVTCKARGES